MEAEVAAEVSKDDDAEGTEESKVDEHDTQDDVEKRKNIHASSENGEDDDSDNELIGMS